MTEWVYVLTVEAFIFGLLSTVLTAQRADVFTWPKDNTWPVLGTSVLVVLLYSLLLVLICVFVKASRLESLTEEVSHAAARSTGRLVAAATLWVVLQSAAVYTLETRDWLIVLCQLWGTTCKNPGSVLWEFSYSVYLAVLLPLFAWFGGMQVVVSGKLASEQILKISGTRRSMITNITIVLYLMSSYTLDENFKIACKGGCPANSDGQTVFDQQPGATRVLSIRVLLVAVFFVCTDVVTGVLAPLMRDNSPRILLFVLVITYAVQIAALPVIVTTMNVNVHPTILWVCFGLACLFGLMDIGEASADWVSSREMSYAGDESKTTDNELSQNTQTLFGPLKIPEKTTPFSIDRPNRKRFHLALGGKGMWPFIQAQSSIKKKNK